MEAWNGGHECMMGCGRDNGTAQPAINSTQKVLSAEGALCALICTLIIEGKKI